MTPRQNEYLTQIRIFFIENDQLPPCEILADRMGVSRNAAHEALNRLHDAGFIEKNVCGKWRFSK